LVNQEFVVELLFKFQEYYDLLIRYEPMARELGNPELLGAFYGRLGHCHFAFGHYDQAIQTLTKAAELCEAAGNAKDAGHAYAYLILSHSDRGDYERVLALKEDLLRTMEQSFNLRWYVRGLSAAQRACSYLGRWDEAVEGGSRERGAERCPGIFGQQHDLYCGLSPLIRLFLERRPGSGHRVWGASGPESSNTWGQSAVAEKSWMGFVPSRRTKQRN
jgi:tetratricopeptide (TPR) repeat protein